MVSRWVSLNTMTDRPGSMTSKQEGSSAMRQFSAKMRIFYPKINVSIKNIHFVSNFTFGGMSHSPKTRKQKKQGEKNFLVHCRKYPKKKNQKSPKDNKTQAKRLRLDRMHISDTGIGSHIQLAIFNENLQNPDSKEEITIQ